MTDDRPIKRYLLRTRLRDMTSCEWEIIEFYQIKTVEDAELLEKMAEGFVYSASELSDEVSQEDAEWARSKIKRKLGR